MDPKTQPGNYHIINAFGGGLAITYHGPDANLTVEVYEPGNAAQTWVVAGDPDDSQSISPLNAAGLQSRPAGNFVQPRMLDGYLWNLWTFGDVAEGVRIVIQDTNALRFWAIEGPLAAVEPEKPVILGDLRLGVLANWNFILIPGP